MLGMKKNIQEVHQAFENKNLSVTELTEHYLKAIRESKSNAFLEVCQKRALDQARAQDEELKKTGFKIPPHLPLFGIPLGIKDALTIDGVRTTCASKMLENYIPPYTATAVERLETAGAITLGKLNMDEFAMGSSNENSAFGSVTHPTHPDRVPGGSSGGSAAAVREGLCLGSLGTDTGGSIRLPAAFCGIPGVKPTYGRISRYGLIAFASSLDQIGPMAGSIEDCARLMQVMAGHDPRDSTSSQKKKPDWIKASQAPPDFKKIKIGVPDEYFIKGISADVQKTVQDALAWYQTQGAELVPVSLPHTSYGIAAYYLIAVSEASSNLARLDGVRFGVRPKELAEAHDLAAFYKKARSLFGAEVKRRILLGTFALSSGYYDAYYLRACQVRSLILRDFENAFKECDFIAGPVAPTTAFKRGEKVSDPLQMYLMDAFTIPASLAGLPALSLPCGEDPDGLSVGLQLIAPHFEESRILAAASAFEKRRA